MFLPSRAAERSQLSTQLEKFEARKGSQEVVHLLQSKVEQGQSSPSGAPAVASRLPRTFTRGVDREWASTFRGIWSL